MKANIRITNELGKVILVEAFNQEIDAQNTFDEISIIRWPQTYKNIIMNCSELSSGAIGSIRLIAIDDQNNKYCRRELYRNLPHNL